MSRTLSPSPSTPRTTPPRRLRQFLALDAVVTAANGLAYVVAAGPLESLLGPPADLLRPIGAFLIAFGVGVALVAARAHPSPAATLTIIGANVLWVAVSLVTLAMGLLSPTLLGGLWIAAQAVVVSGFAAAQNWALRRLP